jgi:hypothetical protein
MQCSIDGLIRVMGGNDPDLWMDQPDQVTFFCDKVSHTHQQLGYITNTRTMMVSIPEDKRQALLTDLVDNWGPTSGHHYFTLSEAAELLGVLVSMSRLPLGNIFISKFVPYDGADPMQYLAPSVESTRVFSTDPRMGQAQSPSHRLIQYVFLQKSGQGHL